MSNYEKLDKVISETNIRVGCRFYYSNVFKPRVNDDGTQGKYGVCVVIPKGDTKTIELIEKAIETAKLNGKTSKWGGKLPAKLATPLHDGDEDHSDDPAFENTMYLNASSKNRPGVRVLDSGMVSEALDEEDFYSGCYGAATINFYPYDTSGKRGVGAGLNNVIKTEDGERMSGGHSAEEDFADLAN